MTGIDSDSLVEDEWYGVRYSGEIPEVAYHSAVYHLTCDDDGPRLELSARQHRYLVDAVKQRYTDIVLRDLLPANRHTSGYRGLRRSLINWKRFSLFCKQYQLDKEPLKRVVRETLSEFLEYELKENRCDMHRGRLNCTWTELLEYAELLGMGIDHLPAGSQNLCRVREEDLPGRS